MNTESFYTYIGDDKVKVTIDLDSEGDIVHLNDGFYTLPDSGMMELYASLDHIIKGMIKTKDKRK